MYRFATSFAWSVTTGRAQTETKLPSIHPSAVAGKRSFSPVALQIRAGTDRQIPVHAHGAGRRGRNGTHIRHLGRNAPRAARSQGAMRGATRCCAVVVVVGRLLPRPSPCYRAKQGYTGTTQVLALPSAPRASHSPGGVQATGSSLVASGSTGRTTWSRFTARRCAPVSISRTQVPPPPPTGLVQAAEDRLLQRDEVGLVRVHMPSS
jgi:hypothetical protein